MRLSCACARISAVIELEGRHGDHSIKVRGEKKRWHWQIACGCVFYGEEHCIFGKFLLLFLSVIATIYKN